MDTKFHLNFLGNVKPAKLFEIGLSKAELKEAKANMLLPEVDKNNFDILPVVFNLAVVNQFNDNGDGMSTDTAIEAIKLFKNKPINIEHKKDRIVGHIVNASFSEEEPEFMERDVESFRGRQDPFYITIGGLIYSSIYPDLAEEIVESSKHSSKMYNSISSSWEIAFKEYDVCLGNTRNLRDCEIVEATKKEELKPNLKMFGGSGRTKDGENAYLLIKSPAIPLGAGLTVSPAARVNGIYTKDALLASTEGNIKKNNEKKFSLLIKNPVKKVKSTPLDMDEKQFAEFLNTVKTALANNEEAKASGGVLAEIREAIKDEDKRWKSKAEKAEQEKKEVQDKLSQAEKKVLELEEAQSNNKKELDQLKAKMEAAARNEVFQNRMNLVEQRFDLSEAESSYVASQVKGLGQEEVDFEKFEKEVLNVIFAHKNKEAIKAAQQEEEAKRQSSEDKKESTASKTEADEDLETEANKESKVPNSNREQTTEKSLYDRVRENLAVEVKQ